MSDDSITSFIERSNSSFYNINSKKRKTSRSVNSKTYSDLEVNKSNIFDSEISVDEVNNKFNDNNDIDSVVVLILNCDTKKGDSNIKNIKWLFSDPYFIVKICTPNECPSNVTIPENYMMEVLLSYAKNGPYEEDNKTFVNAQSTWSDKPVIIIKDSSVCNIPPDGITNTIFTNEKSSLILGIKNKIKIALANAPKADLFFLCKWDDMCNKYLDVDNYPTDRTTTLKYSFQPTATQAIMYRPNARDYVRNLIIENPTTHLSNLLNSHINKRKLVATVFVPNLLDFDINLVKSNSDYIKLNECSTKSITLEKNLSNNTDNSNFFVWFILLIILIIFLIIIILQFALPQ